MAEFSPADGRELQEIVAAALAEERPLEILGAGSKRALGRPVQAADTLSLARLSGIVDYQPAELVLTARAGTPLAVIEAALAERGQMLAFEPPDWGPLLGVAGGGQTIGGVIAGNFSGPRRPKAGAARDHFLGFAGVSGRGEAFKAGGKVVKNVTGYDLPKLLAGSWGTLAVLAEVTVKVLPRPEETRSVLIFGLADGPAVAVMAEALNLPHDVSAAAHLPAALAGRSAVRAVAGSGTAVTALRIEGPLPSAEHRAAALRLALAPHGPNEALDAAASLALWREIADAAPLMPLSGLRGQSEDDPAAILWRVSLPPAAAPGFLVRLAAAGLAFVHFFDWGGGLVWLGLAGDADCGAASIRAALAPAGGHSTLIRAPLARRAALAVFEPPAPALAALTARVKESFDPRRILNPGRMYQGI